MFKEKVHGQHTTDEDPSQKLTLAFGSGELKAEITHMNVIVTLSYNNLAIISFYFLKISILSPLVLIFEIYMSYYSCYRV